MQFEIDDDNFIQNGEVFIHLDDIKSMQRGMANTPNSQQPLPALVINSSIIFAFADERERESVIIELQNRKRAARKGTESMKRYLDNQKKAMQQTLTANTGIKDVVETSANAAA